MAKKIVRSAPKETPVKNTQAVLDFLSKKKKPTNSTLEEPGLSKNCSWNDYVSDESFRFFPEKDNWRKRLIYSMYEFLDWRDKKNREPLDIMQFCQQYKIPYMTLNSWVKKYEDVAKAYANFKLHLAMNRRMGAMHKELDKDAVYKDQHRYDPEWDEVNKYHASLKNDEGQNETKVVVIERMPSSKMVPEKKK